MSGMKERAERLRRILAVQEQMHRIEEWKLAELQRRQAELEGLQRDIIGALNDDSALHGMFLDAAARRLSSLTEETSLVEGEKVNQVAKLAEETARLRHAERLSSIANLVARRSVERDALVDLIEVILVQSSTSLP